MAMIANMAFHASALVACPESCFQTGRILFCTPSAVADTTYGSGEALDCTNFGSFDHVAGQIESGTGCGFVGDFTRVASLDDFQLAGLPVGTHLYFTIRLHVVVMATRRSTDIEAEIQNGEGYVHMLGVPVAGDTTITLLVQHDVGTPFTLGFVLTTIASESGAAAMATYDVTDLPDVVSVTSCGGYHQGAVPTRGLSWGHLKARYR